MEKEFVPYAEALALKELGFDENCFAGYESINKLVYPAAQNKNVTSNARCYKKLGYQNSHIIKAPLYQQVFRWFRENHDIQCYVDHWCRDAKIREYHYSIEYSKNGARHSTSSVAEQQYNMLNYEEAELACLRKLIEIVKENGN